MSKMNELYQKVSKDVGLQAKFAEIMNNTEKLGEAATKNELILFAREEGYEITLEEMQAFFKDLSDSGDKELSAAELDMVAGGKKKPSSFLISMVTFGYGCAVMTIVDAIRGTNDGCR